MKDSKYLVGITKGVATLRLNDYIGEYFDMNGNVCGVVGNDLAEDIQYLQDKCELIELRINSGGGRCDDGTTIVNAILNSKVPVHTIVEGIAASMACVIACTGQVSKALDYATLMLHNPMGGSESGVEAYRQSVVTIFTNNTGVSADKIEELMDEETWLSAKDAKELGLIDEVIKTRKKVNIDKSSLHAMLACYNAILPPNQMKENIEINIDKIVDNLVVNTEPSELTELRNQLESLRKEKEDLANQLKAIEEEKEKAKQAQAEELVNSFVNSGKITAEERAKYVVLASSDFDFAKSVLAKIGNEKSVPIFNPSDIKASDERSSWDIRDYEKKDPAALKKIMIETPERYEEMLNAYITKKNQTK